MPPPNFGEIKAPSGAADAVYKVVHEEAAALGNAEIIEVWRWQKKSRTRRDFITLN